MYRTKYCSDLIKIDRMTGSKGLNESGGGGKLTEEQVEKATEGGKKKRRTCSRATKLRKNAVDDGCQLGKKNQDETGRDEKRRWYGISFN